MAVRIAGIIIPNDKRVKIALTYIFGIGRPKAGKILKEAKINEKIRVKDLAEDDINKLRTVIKKIGRVEGDLKRDVFNNIKRLKEIDCYRGTRHKKRLPTRGQRTKTNNRTVRGNVRRTTGSGKTPAAQKT